MRDSVRRLEWCNSTLVEVTLGAEALKILRVVRPTVGNRNDVVYRMLSFFSTSEVIVSSRLMLFNR